MQTRWGEGTRATLAPKALPPDQESRDLGGNFSGHGDIFPLPQLSEPERPVGACRRTVQHWSLRRKVCQATNDTIDALNWMSGYDARRPTSPSRTGRLQDDIIGDIQRLVESRKPTGESSEAAFRALLRGRTLYDEVRADVNLAPYQADRVSLPSDVRDSHPILDLLPPRSREMLEGYQERMLRDGPEVRLHDEMNGEIKPHVDPSLVRNQRRYGQFVKKLDQIGLLRFTTRPKEHVGVFFAHKKGGENIRMIIDARKS